MTSESVHALAWTARRIQKRWKSLIAYSLAFRLLELAILGPISAWALGLFLRRWGRASVGNFEIVSFLLSPAGLAALLVVGTVTLATLYLEIAGEMRLLANDRLAWWQGLSGPARQFPEIVRLGLRQLLVYLLIAAPFLGAIGGAYALLWRGRDLYGLLAMKPPIFWAGAGVAALLVVSYGVVAGRSFLRWLYALPTILFETNVSAPQAMRRSVERTRGRLIHLAAALGLWGVVQLALSAALLGPLRFASGWLLDRLGSSLTVAVPATAAILGVNGLAATALSILSTMTFSGLVLGLYRRTVGVPEVAIAGPPGPDAARQIPVPWLVAGGILALGVVATFAGLQSLRGLRLEDHLEITAHRAGKVRAPENTIAALRASIEDAADWSEIDVQRTADDALVVLHDTDLKRVAGDPRRVANLTLEEIRALDVGSWFSPEFAGERVPTFREFLEVAGDRMRLNVELKPHNRADVEPLTRMVVAAIREAGMTDRCRICSQSYEGLRLAKALEPSMPIGFIVATALGDPAALDVDFLMVQFDRATPALIGRANLRGIGVHAWTVTDPAWVSRLIDRGAANLITDDPALMRARLLEVRGLDPVERLLLNVRDRLTD